MVQSKMFWHFLMIGSIILYGLSLVLGRFLFPGDPLMSRIFFIGLVILHLAEIPAASLKIGRNKGLPASLIALKTLLYGFTWWLPLKKEIIDR